MSHDPSREDPGAVWRREENGGARVDLGPAGTAARVRQATVRRRDRIVFACAAIIAPSWAAAMWLMPDLRAVAAAGFIVAVWVAAQTYRRSAARVDPLRAEMTGVEFERAWLTRERDYYLAMPWFYLVPVALSQIAILVTLFTNPRFPRSSSVFPVAIVVFVATAAAVLLSARRRAQREVAGIQREIESLPAAASSSGGGND